MRPPSTRPFGRVPERNRSCWSAKRSRGAGSPSWSTCPSGTTGHPPRRNTRKRSPSSRRSRRDAAPSMIVLGLHGGVTVGQHEPAAALAVNGRIIAACEEERYLRNKSAYGYLPYYSIRACLKIANIDFRAIDLVVTPGASYPRFDEVWRDYLRHNFGSSPRIERVHHHMAHLASAFYGSGHREALCLSLDATGDGDCAMLAHATRGDGITVLEEIPTERSLGYFYTLMTYYL